MPILPTELIGELASHLALEFVGRCAFSFLKYSSSRFLSGSLYAQRR